MIGEHRHEHVGPGTKAPSLSRKEVGAWLNACADAEIGPVVRVVVVAGYGAAVRRGERAECVCLALGVQPQQTFLRDIDAKDVPIEQHLELAGDPSWQRNRGCSRRVVAMVVRTGGEGHLQVRRAMRAVPAAHRKAIDAGIEHASDLEVARDAAVVVGEGLVPNDTSDQIAVDAEHSDGVDGAAGRRLHKPALGQLEAEGVHVAGVCQSSRGGGWNRHDRRRSGGVAVVVRCAGRAPKNGQRIAPDGGIVPRDPDEINAGCQGALDEEIAPIAAVVILGQRGALCAQECADGVDAAVGCRAQAACLRQLDTEIVHIVLIQFGE